MKRDWESLISVAMGVARRMRVPQADRNDVAQQAVVKLLEGYDRSVHTDVDDLPTAKSFGLVKSIARNLVLDDWRRSAKRRSVARTSGVDFEAIPFREERVLVKGERSSYIRHVRCVSDFASLAHIATFGASHLPSHHRSVLELCLEGCSHNSISAKLNLPLGTVKTIIRRARMRKVPA